MKARPSRAEFIRLAGDHRLIHAGTVGCIDFAGNLDTASTSRRMVAGADMAWVQAGVVADGRPEREHAECGEKAALGDV